MNNEQYIIGQILMYPQLHHHLSKMNHKWFIDKQHQSIIQSMQKVYMMGEVIDPNTMRQFLNRDELILSIQLREQVWAGADIKRQLIELQYDYILKQLRTKIETTKIGRAHV